MNISRGESIKSNALTLTSLAYVVNELKSEKHRPVVEEVRAQRDKNQRDAIKKKLPYFVPAGLFRDNVRKKDFWKEDSGSVILDVDEYDEEKSSRLVEKASAMSYTLVAFLSPSGGLKLIVKTKSGDTTPEAYLRKWEYVKRTYEKALRVEVDQSGKDPSRACFFSYDPNVYYNPNSEELSIPDDSPQNNWIEEPEPTTSPNTNRESNNWDTSPSKIKAAQNYVQKIDSIEGQNGNDGMMQAARHLYSHSGLSDSDAWSVFMDWNRTKAIPPWSDEELTRAWAAIKSTPSKLPEGCKDRKTNTSVPNPATVAHDGAKKTISGLAFNWFSETKERKPTWVWDGYILKGAAHVLGGKQGTSKGLFTVDIAARLTNGHPMPGELESIEPQKVLFITREDDPEMTLLPRLRMAGAKMDMVAWTHGDFTDGKSMDSMSTAAPHIEKVIKENGISLVFIDPLGSWAEEDTKSDHAVRAIIDPINKVARNTGAAIVFVAHLKKSMGQNDDPMDTFSGSAQVTAAVRVAMLISPAGAHRPKARVLQVVKTNFRMPEHPMLYELTRSPDATHHDDPPVLTWNQASETDQAAANAHYRNKASLVNGDIVLNLLPDNPQRWNDAIGSIHRKLTSKREWDKATKKGVEEAMVELVNEGKAFEGKGKNNARLISRFPLPERRDLMEVAVEAFLADPSKTTRNVASEVGCSPTLAHKAKKKADSILKDEEANESPIIDAEVVVYSSCSPLEIGAGEQ